jgi:hypothetical protein|tara:strand:+ start:297 stop:542 length:246 start_codon:yes stop_codon:yes gene_type:complete
MSIQAKVRSTGKLKGKAQTQQEIVATTMKIQAGELRLGDLADVNASGQSDGVMMIYDAAAGEYKVTTQIENENLNIIGGTY